MTSRGSIFTALVLSSVCVASPALAERGPSVLALVIGNNRSLGAERPDLRYADDDAFKYAILFSAIAESDRIEVLTRPDQESRALYPEHVVTGDPTRAGVMAAARRLKQRVTAAEAEGRASVLYLVFAGHGDEDAGQGFLELEDGRLGKQDLAGILEEVGAKTAHVILDSCNSFFVIHPRRPGGKLWATPTDVVGGLSARGVDVGVFLSTSAEAQTYEWSQLMSGIFSHAVRSGLSGGADADKDGRVSYAELEGFVSTSSSGVKNPLYRPHLYVRPPSSGDVLVDLSEAAARRIQLEGFDSVVTLRDELGVRLVDVNPEPGFSPLLVLPAWGSVSLMTVQPDAEGRRLYYERDLGQPDLGRRARVTPRDLAPAESPRGSDALFSQLFAEPFGPERLARFEGERATRPPPVYGLSRDQEQRLELQLRTLGEQARSRRLVGGGIGLAAAAGALAAGGLLVGADYASGRLEHGFTMSSGGPSMGAISGVAFLTAGIGYAAAFGIEMLIPSDEELIWQSFESQPALTERERTARVVQAVESLEEKAQASRSDRELGAWIAGGTGALMVAGGSALIGAHYLGALRGDPRDGPLTHPTFLGGMLVTAGAMGIGSALLVPFHPGTPIEATLDLVKQDPDRISLDVE